MGGMFVERKTKVVIVEDNKLSGLYLDMHIGSSSDYKIVASLPLADDLPEYVSKHKVNLIILNVSAYRDTEPLSIVKSVKSVHPEIKIILYSSLTFSNWMEKGKEYAVESVWHAESSDKTLLEIMGATMNGDSVYPEEIPEVYLGKLALSKLTKKQMQILYYLVFGLTNKDIAEKLFLSANTVKSYLDDIMMKSEIHSRTQLAVQASKLGLIF